MSAGIAVARTERAATNPDCTGERHTGTQAAWLAGCRCDEAVAAHRAENRRDRSYRRRLPAQVDPETGQCIAPVHSDTAYAWQRGCRCPGAIAAHDAHTLRRRLATRAARKAPTAPWQRWRGPDTRVNRINLFLLMQGFPDSPTPGEYVAAVAKLRTRINRDETGLNNNAEIAAILGIDTQTVAGYGNRAATNRADRARRRLADVALRAHRAGRARARGRGHDASGHPIRTEN